MLTDYPALIELDSVGSTNSWLVSHIRTGSADGTVAVWAKQQTEGRGRMGRSWNAEAGASLCLSVAVPLQRSAPAWVTLAAGVHVLKGLHGMGARQVGLKWPNDLMVQGRKLGGILCESLSSHDVHWLVVGLGLNLKPVQTPVPSICLRELNVEHEACEPADNARRFASLLVTGLEQVLKIGFDGVASDFRQHDVLAGEWVRILGQGQEVMQGRAVGVDETGAYLIETDQGLRAIQSGELSMRAACT